MKKAKIVTFLLIFTLIIGTMTGCGGVNISKLFDTGEIKDLVKESSVTFNKIDKLSYEDEIVESNGELVVFKSENATQNTWTFYNYKTGAVVLTETRNNTDMVNIDFKQGYKVSVIAISTSWVNGEGKTQYKIAVYSEDGALIKEATSEEQSEILELVPVFNIDFLRIGNEYYKADKDGEFNLVAKFADADVIPEFDAKNGDYYYFFASEGLITFNDKLQMVGYYKLPTYANSPQVFIMNNGDMLVQYAVSEHILEKDYSYLPTVSMGMSNPVSIITNIIDVDSGEVKEKELDYTIQALASRETYYAYNNSINASFDLLNSSIKNLAVINEFSDGKLDATNVLASLNNVGKIKDRLDDLFEGQQEPYKSSSYYNLYLPRPINHERFVVTDILGKQSLVTAGGSIIGDVTGVTHMNSKYIILDDVIYDFDLKEVASCKDYELYTQVNLTNSFIFTKEVENVVKYYVFNNGEFKHLTDQNKAQIVTYRENILLVKNLENNKISVYNENLEVLLTTDAQIRIVSDINDKLILSGYNSVTSKTETYVVYQGK